MEISPLVQIINASTSSSGHTLVEDFSLNIIQGKHVALLGGVASGKTSLLKMLAGKLPLRSGSITYYNHDKTAESSYLFQRDHVEFISFEPQFLHRESYYQQRFNSTEIDDLQTLDDYIKFERSENFEKIATFFGLHELLSRPLITLSSGQMRKALIAQALLRKPQLLLLDNPFAGLDSVAREALKRLLKDICNSIEMTMVLACSRREEIPEHFQQVVELSGNQYCSKANVLTFQLPTHENNYFNIAVEFKNVHIAYDKKAVLKDINFCIKRSEKWALLGRNGAGKSTLMSLIYGDHPQAYANQITLFDRPKGSGESIWEIKQRVGFCSPELHAYFHEPLSCFEVICTGFNSTFIPKRNLSHDELKWVDELLNYYGAIGLKERSYLHISSGEQRLIMLLRALVKKADMLILDEPFQCFDNALVERSKLLIDQLACNKTLLFTSHYRQEIPACITHTFEL